jgi:3-oxosteroid 1-dehydrogenase
MSAWDKVYDLVCVGSGAGGLTAAVVAAKLGAKVLVLEKDDLIGGVTALTGGQIWIAPNPLERELGIDDSVQDAVAYLDFLSAGLGSVANRNAFVRRGGEAVSFLATLGLRLKAIPGLADYYFPDAPGSRQMGRYLEVAPFLASALGRWSESTVVGQGAMTTPHGGSFLTNSDLIEAGADQSSLASKKIERAERDERCMGSGLIANLLDMALCHGVDVWVKSPATALIGETKVEGIVAGAGSAARRIKTNNVLLATGAYDWSPELVETHEFIKDMYSLTPPSITGDHFQLASQLRAAVATTLPQGCSRHVGINVPGETWGGKPLYRMMIMGLPHCIMVNRMGRRFGDESFFHTYSSTAYEFDGHTQTFPNWPAWFVFDHDYKSKYALGPIAPGETMPPGMAMHASSLRELAALTGIDPEGLVQTVERFNAGVDAGVDLEFKRGTKLWSKSWGDARMKNPNLGAVAKPPFYAISLARVGTGLASAGLKTDAAARVIGVTGNPIDGLYAVGNSAARIEMGCGYNSGMAIGRSLVFGYVAAMDAFDGMRAGGSKIDATSVALER